MSNKANKKIMWVLVVGTIIFMGVIVFLPKIVIPEVTEQKYQHSVVSIADTVIVPNRHCGYVSLDKLKSETKCTSKDKGNDSVILIFNRFDNKRILGEGGRKSEWIKKYGQMLPISLSDTSLTAKKMEINDTVYIYIPYQIVDNVMATRKNRNE